MRKILAFAGSSSKNSINRSLVDFVCDTYFKDCSINFIDLKNYEEVPIYSVDREKNNGIPKEIIGFVDEISNSDGLVISLAEHNGSYTAVFKNIMDWSSRHKKLFFDNKKMLLMSTSPGGYGGKNVLNSAIDRLPKLGADVVSTFSLPSFNDHFQNGELNINDEKLKDELVQKVNSFKELI